MRTKLLTITTLTLLALAGCGDTETKKPQAQHVAPNDKQAAIKATQTLIDNDDCNLLSDEFLAASYDATGAEGRALCKDDNAPGKIAGDYKVGDVTIKDDKATVTLNLTPAGKSTVMLTKANNKWLVDDIVDNLNVKVGQTIRYITAYLLNDAPTDIRADITIKKIDETPPLTNDDTAGLDKPGYRWVGVEVQVINRGRDTVTINTQDFYLVDNEGGRYKTEYGLLKPELGSDTADVSAGDKLTGWLTIQLPSKAKIKEIKFSPPEDSTPMSWSFDR